MHSCKCACAFLMVRSSRACRSRGCRSCVCMYVSVSAQRDPGARGVTYYHLETGATAECRAGRVASRPERSAPPRNTIITVRLTAWRASVWRFSAVSARLSAARSARGLALWLEDGWRMVGKFGWSLSSQASARVRAARQRAVTLKRTRAKHSLSAEDTLDTARGNLHARRSVVSAVHGSSLSFHDRASIRPSNA